MNAMPYFSKRLKVFLLVSAILFAFFVLVDLTGLGREYLAVSVALNEDSDMGRAEFLAEYGWEISTVPIEVVQVTIPTEFNAVYTQYNDLQRAQGFDLEGYRGKRVTRYTYSILNYPQEVNGVRANLLIYKGKVIGGDICTVALDGFMHGFEREDHGVTHETFLGMVSG